MGLKNNTQSMASFVKFKDGLFYTNTDKETGYNEIEGYITSFNVVDEEWEGVPVKKLIIKLTDEDGEKYIIKLTFETSYVTSLISFLKNADLADKLSLVGMSKPDKETGKVRNSILIRQGDSFVKGFYTKDNPNGLPAMKQVTVNKKKIWDKADMTEFLEDVVLNEFNSKLSANPAPVGFKKVKEEVPDLGDTEGDETTDLPF